MSGTRLIISCAAVWLSASGLIAERVDSGKTTADKSQRIIRHSDVVMSWAGAPDEDIREYGVTVLGWGGGDVDKLRKMGLRLVCGGFAYNVSPDPLSELGKRFKTDPVLMKANAVDIAGNTIHVPYWKRVFADGTQCYWVCTNNPGYRDALRARVLAKARSGTDMLTIDNFSYPTWAWSFRTWTSSSDSQAISSGGCLCDYCVAGFREYLNGRYSARELRALGVEDIASFDYRTMVRKSARSREALAQDLDKVPLIYDYQEYHHRAGVALAAELKRYASEVTGRYYPLGGNTAHMTPDNFTGFHLLDYCTAELDYGREPGGREIFGHKFAEALNKPFANWPVGQSAKYISEANRVDLLKTWIAMSYALGGNLMIPSRLFSESTVGGFRTFEASAKDFAPLYHFVASQAALFDDYEPVEQVKVLYSNLSERLVIDQHYPPGRRRFIAKTAGLDEADLVDLPKLRSTVSDTASSLFRANVPFGFAVAGDDWLSVRLDEAALAGFPLIVVPEPLYLDPQQRRILMRAGAGKTIHWTNEKDTQEVLQRVKPLVSVKSNGAIRVLLRAKRRDPSAPLVIHVLNCGYDAQKNRTEPQRDIVLHLSDELVGSRKIERIRLHAPQQASRELSKVESGPGMTPAGAAVRLPEVRLWALVEVDFDAGS